MEGKEDEESSVDHCLQLDVYLTRFERMSISSNDDYSDHDTTDDGTSNVDDPAVSDDRIPGISEIWWDRHSIDANRSKLLEHVRFPRSRRPHESDE
jgi:hypothetical protein